MADQAKMRAIEIFNSDVQKLIQELPQHVEIFNGLPRVDPKWLEPEFTSGRFPSTYKTDLLTGLGVKISYRARTELNDLYAAGVPQDFVSIKNMELLLRLGKNADDMAAAVQLKYAIDAEKSVNAGSWIRQTLPDIVVDEKWVALQSTPEWKSVAALAANAEKNFDEQARLVGAVRAGADTILPPSPIGEAEDGAKGRRYDVRVVNEHLDNGHTIPRDLYERPPKFKFSAAPIMGLAANSTGILVAGKDAEERIQPYLHNGTVNQDAAGDYRYAAMQAKAIELATGFPELGSGAYKSWAETHHVPLEVLAELDTTGVAQIDILVNPLRTLSQEY